MRKLLTCLTAITCVNDAAAQASQPAAVGNGVTLQNALRLSAAGSLDSAATMFESIVADA